MEIKYTLLEDDFIKFNLYHLRNSKLYKKEIFIMKYIVNTVLAFMIFIIGTFIFEQSMLIWLFIAISFLIVQIKTTEKQNDKIVIRRIKKQLKDVEIQCILGEKILKVDADKIHIKSELFEETKDIKAIIEVKKYDDLILLYDSSITAEIIPTRYLIENEIDTLISILTNTK